MNRTWVVAIALACLVMIPVAASAADRTVVGNITKIDGMNVMVKGQDYGVIPGTAKPTLLKPGAEKLAEYYGYAPIVKEPIAEEHHRMREGQVPADSAFIQKPFAPASFVEKVREALV